MTTQDTVKVVIGGAGMAASTAVEQIPIDQLEGGMGILTQIVILVATLSDYSRKRKNLLQKKKANTLKTSKNVRKIKNIRDDYLHRHRNRRNPKKLE